MGPDGHGTTASSSVSPLPIGGFNPRSELVTVRAREATTDKVVAELKFVFWQKMFTQRFDARLWDGHILSLFPNAAVAVEADLRSRIYSDLEVIRKLRNRMAHHEPILPEILTMNWLRFWTSFNFVRRRFPHGFGQTSQSVVFYSRSLHLQGPLGIRDPRLAFVGCASRWCQGQDRCLQRQAECNRLIRNSLNWATTAAYSVPFIVMRPSHCQSPGATFDKSNWTIEATAGFISVDN